MHIATVKKKILSLILALVLTAGTAVIGIPSVTVTAYAEETAAAVLPNLDNLETPLAALPEFSRNTLPGRQARTTMSSDSGPTAVNGRLTHKPLLPDSDSRARTATATNFLQNPTVGDTCNTITNWDDVSWDGVGPTLTINAKVAAIGANCVVYVDTDTNYTAKAGEFLPTGTTENAKAKAIANKFDSEIYPLLTANSDLGYLLSPYYFANTANKINIVLFDIDNDGAPGGGVQTYSAGFFSGNDYLNNNYSNHDAALYIDIGEIGGYSKLNSSPDGFYGTIAHELQHLFNFSQWRRNYEAGTVYTYQNDPDGSQFTTTWLDEGLSGLVDAFYGGMPGSHFEQFAKQNFAAGIGYIPTSDQWYYGTSGYQTLAQYGASSMMMQEFWAGTGGVLTPAVQYPVYGYWGSLDNIGENFWNGVPGAQNYGFDEFFIYANLNIGVDTPQSSWSNIQSAGKPVYTNATPYNNLWADRDNLVAGNPYAGVIDIAAANDYSVSTDFGNREYFAQLYLSEPVGAANNTVNVTIPAGSNASYYIITPFNAINVNTNAAWNDTGKIAASLASGANAVQVGTNNRFAILVINYDTAIPAGKAFSYTTGNSIMPGTVTPNPAILYAGTTGQTVTVAVTTSTIANGENLTASVVKASDNSAASGFTLVSGTNAVNNNSATVSFNIADTVAADSYKIALSHNGNTPVYSTAFTIASTYSITVNNGTASKSSAAPGETVTITVDEPAAGEQFKEWTSSDVSFADATRPVTTFTMPDNDVTVTATYESIPAGTHSVTVNYGTSDQSYATPGNTITITADAPAADEQFKEWTTSSSGVSFADAASPVTTFTMPDNNVTVTATYEASAQTHTVTVNNGTADKNFATPGNTITITADTPAVGEQFKEWTTSSSGVSFADSTSPVTTFTMPDNDVTVTATYESDNPIPNPNQPGVTPSSISIDLRYSHTQPLQISLGMSSDGVSQLAQKATLQVADNGIADISANEVSASGSVIVTGKMIGNTAVTVTFFDGTNQQIGSAVQVPVNVIYSSGSSESSSGSGRSFNNNAGYTSSSAPANTPSDVGQSEATDAVKKAAANAKSSGSDTAIVRMKNVGNIKLGTLKAMSNAAGMPVKFSADSMSADGRVVDARITLDPAKSTKDLNLSVSISSKQTESTKKKFENFFDNKVAVISCVQQGAWGQSVEIAARVDLTGMDTKNLHFYSYDKATNTYKRIENSSYWIDKNGYLHFNTMYAGDIIISDGPLVQKGQN